MMRKIEYLRRVLSCVTALGMTMGVVSCGTKNAAEVAVEEGTFRIEGHVEHVPDSAVVVLLRGEGGSLAQVAADTLVDGRFTLTDTISRPTRYHIFCKGEEYPEWLTAVWVDDGRRIEITGDGVGYGLWDIDSDIEEQAEENRYTAAASEAIRLLMELPDSLTESERSRRYVEGCELLVGKGYDYMMTAEVDDFWLDKFVRYHGIWRTTTRPALDWERLADRMSDEQRRSPLGQVIESLVHPIKKICVGDKMPDAPFVDMEGRRRSLSEFARRYVLLDFWGAGCTACGAAVPELEAVADKYGSRLAVIHLSVDSREVWQHAVKERRLEGLQWLDTAVVGKSLPVRCGAAESGLPYFVLIAPTGKVADMWSGYTEGSIGEKLSAYLFEIE